MILGHQRQLAYLNKVLKGRRLSHAYLFYGPEHVGKFMIAQELAKMFYCRTKKSIEDLCAGCKFCRMVEDGFHPDVYIVDAEHPLRSNKEGRKEIAIDDVRELKRIFSLKSSEGKMRVVIINKAEKMSQEAANAFLKLLEEAPESSLFILISSDRDLLLPTIVSRTQPLFFSLVPRDTLNKFIASRSGDERLAGDVLNFAGGRPGIAFALLNEPGLLDEERKLYGEMRAVLERQLPQVFLLSERVAFDEAQRNRVVGFLLGRLREELRIRVGDRNVLPLVDKIKNVLRIAHMIETTNVNTRLALDVMLMEAGI